MYKPTMFFTDMEYQEMHDKLYVEDKETGEILLDKNAIKKYLDEQFEVNADRVLSYYKELVAMSKSIKEEEKVLYERRKKLEEESEKYRESLLESMQMRNKKSFESSKNVAKLRWNPPSYKFDCELLPKEFVEEKIERTLKPKREELIELIKQGNEITGATVTKSQRVDIK